MTTAATAGEQAAKAAPAPAAARPAARRGRPRGPKAPDKPWHEQTLADRYGTAPRPVHLGKQVKDVLRYLEAHQERVVSWEEVVTSAIPAWYDCEEGGELYNLLTTNARVAATAGGFNYKSGHGVVDKASLLAHIRARPEGVRSSDIKDGYDEVLEDAAQLLTEGSLYRFYNAEFKVDVYFAAPQGLAPLNPDLVDVFLKTQVPAEPQALISEVTKLGLRSVLASVTAERKPIALTKERQAKKKKRRLNTRHITNTHLVSVLREGEQYETID